MSYAHFGMQEHYQQYSSGKRVISLPLGGKTSTLNFIEREPRGSTLA